MRTEHYRIDADMLGDRWGGSPDDLRAFAEILAKQTGKPVRAVTEITNGAYNRANGDIDSPDITEAEWNAALDAFAKTNPGAWR